MNYIQQYNTEFKRIYTLIKKTIGKDYPLEFAESPKTSYGYIEFIADFMTSKDKKGDFVLVEGGDENPTFLKLKESIKENQLLSNGYYTGQVIVAEVYLTSGALPTVKTLRDLFRKNCIPANDPDQDKIQIENLKLIKW